jgi:hypothetical protein
LINPAFLSRHRTIAIGPATCIPAVANDPIHPAPDFVCKAGQKQQAKRTAHTDLDLVGFALVDGSEFDAQEIQSLPERRPRHLPLIDAVTVLQAYGR